MEEFKCPFCGSTKIKIETPYIDMHGKKIFTYCCDAQKKNAKYVESHTSNWTGAKPDIEKVSKW